MDTLRRTFRRRHRKDYSEINPLLKYFLFFENFLIWVSERVPDLSVKLIYYDPIDGLNFFRCIVTTDRMTTALSLYKYTGRKPSITECTHTWARSTGIVVQLTFAWSLWVLLWMYLTVYYTYIHVLYLDFTYIHVLYLDLIDHYLWFYL